MPPQDYQTFYFQDAGWCPNNPAFPLAIYRGVRAGEPEKLAQWFEKLFARNGWPPAWRYTVFDYAHYHSNTHEVLGIFQGEALIRFGDATGENIECRAGDAVLIPAGFSHQRLHSTSDFTAVGAYPAGCEPDEIRPASPLRGAASLIAQVPLPSLDPVYGTAAVPLHNS